MNYNTENKSVAFGLTVVTDQAVGIGVTAVPTPITDDANDWFLYERLLSRFVILSASGVSQPAGVMNEFDSKAMRKLIYL